MTDSALKADVPAPWTLHGVGYILAIRMPRDLLDNESNIPPSLAGQRKGPIACVMLVDYAQSNAGPYRELLYIPGLFRFPGAIRPSITRIYVSTMTSVMNGRKNWGIPKDRCDFDIRYGADGIDHFTMQAEDGTVFAEFSFRHKGFQIPINTRLIPKAFHTFSQHWEGTEYTYTLEAKGRVKPAKLLSARFNPDYFPDLARGKVLACVKATQFEMVFPVSKTRPLT
ncbi:MAG: acetoacetate decarboxylase family protein [Pseudomonadota bacterium]|nr:acetoacetate decarboxylase family protein [Pseudomonadota bacterium]